MIPRNAPPGPHVKNGENEDNADFFVHSRRRPWNGRYCTNTLINSTSATGTGAAAARILSNKFSRSR